jgi:ferric-dicitrate binding protein FerR (iron transport regulator)
MTFPPALETELLDRYLANECTPTERVMVEAWIAAHKSGLQFSALRQVATDPFGPVSFSSPAQIRERMWNAVTAAEQADTFDSPALTLMSEDTLRQRGTRRGVPSQSVRTGTWSSKVWAVIAAGACAIVVAVVVGLFTAGQHSMSKTPAVSAYITAKGERARITLPDGTNVILNVASRLDVPVTFMSGKRVVYLHGEALFTAAHRSNDALTIVTDGITTRVLGTTFAVRHYETDTTTTVAVREGKVSVQSVVLTAGQEVRIGRTGAPHVIPADFGRFTFADGVLTLPWMSLHDAAVELGRWYNLDVHIANTALGERRVRLVVPDASAGDLAVFLETVLGVRAVRHGRTLTLFPQ